MMKKRRFIKDNQGYSLVELVIVIAIIALLTVAAFATITIMHSAKAKEAATTFESELSELSNKARGQVCIVDGTIENDYRFCISLYKVSDRYYIRKGYYIGGGADYNSASSYIFKDSDNAGGGKGVSLSPYVYVKYTDAAGVEHSIGSGDGALNSVYIVFNKNGTCVSGYGEFNFFKDNGNKISTVRLNKNGSHQSN